MLTVEAGEGTVQTVQTTEATEELEAAEAAAEAVAETVAEAVAEAEEAEEPEVVEAEPPVEAEKAERAERAERMERAVASAAAVASGQSPQLPQVAMKPVPVVVHTSGDEAGTSSGAQTTAEGVLTLGTLDDDALSAIFRSLPVSHDTLQMYANLKAVSKRMLRVTRAQMRNNHLALTLQTVWHRFPGTNIPYRAETVPPTRVVQNQDEYFDWVESDDMQWCAQNGLRVSNSFQCAPGFDAESLEGIDEGDGIIPFFIVVQLNYDLVDILHPSMVPENTGGMADLSRLPNEIRASMGLTGLTVPYDSLVFGGLGDYYRLVQVTQDTTMQAIFDAIAGHEGWNTSTSNLPFNTSTPDVPFDMRLDIDALGENTTVMHTMTAAEELQVRWVLVVDWPSLSTEVVAAGPTTLAETTQVEVVAGDTVAPQEDVGMTYVPPAQQEGAALVYDPVTNEWSYA